MEAVKRSLRLAQQRLEESIRIKEQRVQLRVLEEDVQRVGRGLNTRCRPLFGLPGLTR